MTIRVLIFNGLRKTASIKCMKIWPPSNPGIGKIFKNAKFTLNRAMKVKKGVMPASAVCPANCAIIIGPPRSDIEAAPEPSICKL